MGTPYSISFLTQAIRLERERESRYIDMDILGEPRLPSQNLVQLALAGLNPREYFDCFYTHTLQDDFPQWGSMRREEEEEQGSHNIYTPLHSNTALSILLRCIFTFGFVGKFTLSQWIRESLDKVIQRLRNISTPHPRIFMISEYKLDPLRTP